MNRQVQSAQQGPLSRRTWRGFVRPRLLTVRAWMLRQLTRDAAGMVVARGMEPVSRKFGFDRGVPIDRYYVEHFLARQSGEEEYGAGDITGRVLEIGDDRYTKRFGKQVERSDVFNFTDVNPGVTIVGDMTREEDMPPDAFDCIICTQTLLVIYDFRAAIRTLTRGLRPGGVLLMTNPGISRLCRPDVDLWGDYWRFTTLSMRRLLEEVFPPEQVRVEAYGNVLSASAALYGLAASELSREQLDLRDADYEVIVAARALKAS